MKNIPKSLARLHVAFVLSCSLLIGTTDAFMGHGTSKSSRRESNAKSITSYSTSPPGENRDDIPETFSSLKNNNSTKSHRMLYLEGKAEYAVEKNLNLSVFEKEAELHVEQDMELEAEMNVHQRSAVDQSHSVSTPIDDANESEKSSDASEANVPRYDRLNSSFDKTPSSTIFSDRETPISSFQTYGDGGNQKKRALTPEELRSLELAAEEKAEKHVIQNAEHLSEIAVERKVEELIDRDSQGGSTTTNESWNPVLGSKTVTKSTWFVSSYTLSKESNQELVPNEASFPSLETFPGTSVGVSQSIQQQNANPTDLNATSKLGLEPDGSVAARPGDDIHQVEKGYTSESSTYDTGTEKDENKNMKYTSVEEIQTTTVSSLFGLAQGENLETTRKLTSPTLMSEMSINDLESMVEKMAEKGIEINAMEKAVEVNAETMIETGLQCNANKDTLSPVVKRGDAPVVDEPTTIGTLEREMFQRSLMQTRFKIDQLERDQRASEKVLLGRDKLINTMPTVEYSLSKNDVKDNEDEVDADAKEEMRNDASELEIFQRSLMETRFKIDKVQREIRAKKKAFVTHRKILEARLHDEFLDRLKQHHILQTDGVNEIETAKEAIAENFHRTLLATRFSMDKCAKEKRRLVIAEAKQQELMKARFAHEAKVKLKREEIKAAVAERVQRALLATRLSMEIRVKEKTKVFIAEAKQRDLLKARFAYEVKARERREKAIKPEDKLTQESSSVETDIDESIQKATHETSLHVMKSEPRHMSGSKIKLDDSKPIHKSSSNDLTSEVGAMLEKAKSVVSKVTNEARNAIGRKKKDSKEKKKTAKKGKKSSEIKKNAADSSMKQRFSLLSKLGFMDDAEENSMPQTAKEISTYNIGNTTDLTDKQRDTKVVKSNKFGRKHNRHQVSNTEKEYAKKKAAIMSARKQPKSKREEKSLAKKYGRLEPKERAYKILLDLGMIIEHPDPDSPSYDHTFDDEFVPFGEWV